MTSYLPSRETLFACDLRHDLIAAGGEFIGTITFLLLGLGGVQAAATSVASAQTAAADASVSQSISAVASVEQLIFIAASLGLALLIAAWMFFRVTGGLFNPNVSLALCMIGAIKPIRFAMYCIAQLLGAIVASAILVAMLPGELVVTPSLGAGTTVAQGLFIEMFITCALCLSVLMMAAEKSAATPFAPIGVGLTLFTCHLFAVAYTGAGMNFARAFGPAVATASFDSSFWIYFIGDGLGSFLAVAIYAVLKAVEYTKLNPGQDSVNETDAPAYGYRGAREQRRVSVGSAEKHPLPRYSVSGSGRRESAQTGLSSQPTETV